MRKIVEKLNSDMSNSRGDAVVGNEGEDRVKWIEARQLISKNMLADHVHLNENGYRLWDEIFWPYIAESLGLDE